MTFLNPAILFGMLAASIPVVLHFLNLRKLKKIKFSTLSFLKELQKTKIRKIKLKQWLLLILRVLIILFLVLAFARPTVKSISFGSSTAKTSAVIIIDNTFSMSVVSTDGSYFNRAKQIAKSLLNNFQDGDEVAVIPVAEIEGKESSTKSNLAYVKKEIDDIQLSNVSGTLNKAIVYAGQILYNSKNYNKEIYLLTDLQNGRFYDFKSELSDLSHLLSGARIYLADLHSKDASNLGVSEFKINNQIFEKNKTVSFNSIITNYSNESVNNSVASLFINGKRSAQQSLSIAGNESANINFETTLSDTGIVQASIELEDDDINMDNKRYLDFYVPAKINVLMLTDYSDDTKFLQIALANLGSQNMQIKVANTSQLSSFDLLKFDCVILIGSEITTNIGRLLDYVENGGGLLLMPGSKSSIASLQNTFSGLHLPKPLSFMGKRKFI